MAAMTDDRYCSEIVAQTDLLRSPPLGDVGLLDFWLERVSFG